MSLPDSLGLPSVLNYITQEFRRFERERAMWESERSQLNSKVAVLEAQNEAAFKSVDDLKRRVVMLQYALRQERAKAAAAGATRGQARMMLQILRSGKKIRVKADTVRIPSLAELEAKSPASATAGSSYSITERSRSLLRSYLQEMGLQNTMVHAPAGASPSKPPRRDTPTPVVAPEPASSGFDMDALSAVTGAAEPAPVPAPIVEPEATVARRTSSRGRKSKLADQMRAFQEAEAAREAEAGAGAEAETAAGNEADSELGGLAELSADIAAGAEESGNGKSSLSGAPVWKQKHLLRSHLDEVRAVAFHASEPGLVTASEDGTLKLWNMNVMAGGRKSSQDHEPVFTFRGHRGPVYCCAVDSHNNMMFSGAADGNVRVWKLPSLASSPYESHGSASAYKLDLLSSHTDAVWGVAVHSSRPLVVSIGADGFVKLWNYSAALNAAPLVKGGSGSTGTSPVWSVTGPSVPTAVTFLAAEPGKVVVTYRDSSVILHDLETGAASATISLPVSESGAGGVTSQPNAVAAHPTLPWLFTAHEDKRIVIYNVNSSEVVDTIVAHPSGVASVAVHPSGLYFMSGGHDSSVRFWDVSTRRCVQAVQKHLRKHEASINAVAYHEAMPFCATGGADSNVRLYGC
ncbi:striatin [Thecamonas trahens ATCC 50062]|uniref:Striatin n=1 Tax=Thecamonas trahens ATCC 50062 TaxID=461836 RepID=A0A0L0DLS6_THETB|nr:striatin [Thecamonas trahens ATCC 50062]KNC52348.1 striatin [Thecamonas trahens ATCC 50062]|eukprot:XP_013755398.1 striatin [Thecamonas trahens ATCC 50062]